MCLKKHHRAQDREEKKVYLSLRADFFVPSHQNQNQATRSGSSLDREAEFGVWALPSLWLKPS